MLTSSFGAITLLSLFVSRVAGYSFTFANSPRQCQNVTLNITGTDGKPPYRVLIVPSGSSPIPKEVRQITEVNFTGNSDSVTFQMKYPTSSGFVAVVSDSSEFGNGGTSGTVFVQDSDDDSCFNANNQVSPAFVFSIVPLGQLIQCQNTRLWWDPSVETETPQFHIVIPAGNSIEIPQGQLSTVQSEGRGFNWTVDIKFNENVLLVAGDSRGTGSGGSANYVVQQVNGAAPEDSSCLNANSPSRTSGSPAGGTYPTTTSQDPSSSTGGSSSPASGSGGNSSSQVNAGAIAGGVVGGIVALVLIIILIIFCLRRSRKQKRYTGGAVDIEDDEGPTARNPHDLPQGYQPQPFMVPTPAQASRLSMSEVNRSSLSDSTSAPLGGRADTVDGGLAASSVATSQQPRKSPLGPTVLRPVNVFQHDDAGHQEEEGSETIELPPAYNKIKQPQASGSGDAEAEAEQDKI